MRFAPGAPKWSSRFFPEGHSFGEPVRIYWKESIALHLAGTRKQKPLYKKDDLKYYPQIVNSPVFQGAVTPDSKHSQKREEK
jgi:hypothetical protein